MPIQETLYNVANRVATITLNRPDKLNAWTALMESEVRSHMENAEQDDEVRVIVLTGAGRGFCAGADMSLLSAAAERGLDYRDLDDRGREQVLRYGANRREGAAPDFQKKYSYFPAIGKPVIAAINGPVVGLGLVITLYCDLRLASDASRFSTTFARRGLIAEYGMAWMLPRIVGIANALDLLFSARTIDAAEALAHGVGESSFSPGNLSRKNPGVCPRTGFHGEPALVAHNQAPGIRGHVATARGSFRHFCARDDGVFPHRGFQRGCRALCREAPACFHG
jgi:enoyl-CoA hydratase/carnithine racemase